MFLRNKKRDIGDTIRELSIPYNLGLTQRLPAEIRYTLEHGITFLDLQEQRDYPKMDAVREQALDEFRRQQHAVNTAPQDWHRCYFERIRSAMPVRDRLASTLFEQETLRGPAGLSALHDMRALLSQSQDIEICRGLEADKCHCPKRDPTWRHVQACHSKFLRAQHSKGTIVEFCFECDIWIISTSQ